MNVESDFAAALWVPGQACPLGLQVPAGVDPQQRFAVHRNNVLSSLVEALAENCPVTRALVGAEFFQAMALAFVSATPPKSPLLHSYGQGFAEFIEGFPPAAGLPYLADMTRLELARVRSYHAADAQAIAPAVLAEYLAKPQQLTTLCLQLHPAVQVIRSGYAVLSLWAAHQPAGSLAAVDPYCAEQGLLLRPELEVLLLPITSASAECIDRLRQGQPLAVAAQCALQHDADFDLTSTLALLLRWGAISACWVLPI